MPLTAQQTRLAETIDTQVTQVLAHGGGDEALLLSMVDSMGTFKQALQEQTPEYHTCSIFRFIAHPELCNVCCFRAAVRG
jgi:hypothetical protein